METNTPPPDDAADLPHASEPEALAGGSADDAVIAATAAKAAVALPAKPKMKVHRPDGSTTTTSAPAVSSSAGGAGGGSGGRPPMTLYSAEPAKRRRRWPWVVGGIGALLVIGVLGVVGYGYWYVQDTVTAMTHSSNRQQQEAQNGLAIATTNEPITALIIGEDHRPGESGGRSDTMMMLRVDPRTKTISMLSFPRDLIVDVPGYGRRPINEAYEIGQEPLALATVKQLTGVQINYLIPVDFRAFTRIVGTFGGVWLPVDRRYYNVNDGSEAHNYMSINIQPGYQLLRGTDSLAFARFRHLDSDLIRMARQQTFVREFKKRVDNWGLASRLIELISILRDNIKILGSNKKPADAKTLLEYGQLMASIPRGNVQQVRLDDISSSTKYPGKLEATPQAVQKVVDEFLNPDTTSGNAIASRDVAKDPKAKVKKATYNPDKMGVEVRNGNGTPAAAADASWQLVENGWKLSHSAGDSLTEYL
ncbi:MAG: LCP family protein, partial [Gaiellales bacterium]